MVRGPSDLRLRISTYVHAVDGVDLRIRIRTVSANEGQRGAVNDQRWYIDRQCRRINWPDNRNCGTAGCNPLSNDRDSRGARTIYVCFNYLHVWRLSMVGTVPVGILLSVPLLLSRLLLPSLWSSMGAVRSRGMGTGRMGSEYRKRLSTLGQHGGSQQDIRRIQRVDW